MVVAKSTSTEPAIISSGADTSADSSGSKRSTSSASRVRPVIQGIISAEESQLGASLYGHVTQQILNNIWEQLIPKGGPADLKTFLAGVGHFTSMVAGMPATIAQQWEAQCLKMEAFLLEKEGVYSEIGNPALIENFKEHLDSLNMTLEDVGINYKEGENVMEVLTSHKLSRERERKRISKERKALEEKLDQIKVQEAELDKLTEDEEVIRVNTDKELKYLSVKSQALEAEILTALTTLDGMQSRYDSQKKRAEEIEQDISNMLNVFKPSI